MRQLEVLYEDESLLVVNKPAGLLSIPDRYDPEKPNLLDQLRQQYQSIYVVHRLDRETSGAICFAKAEAAHRDLSLQFEEREAKKHYLVLINGQPTPPEGSIDKPIMAGPGRPRKMVVHREGKPALTHYRILETFGNISLAEVDLKTGRTHQIRVHFQAIGHPLMVDALYGGREAFYLSEVKGKAYKRSRNKPERPLMYRVSLHARRLEIRHPVKGDPISVEASLPKDFSAVLKQLRKWSAP